MIAESTLPLQVLYNSKIERIRFLEYEIERPPQPIKYEISDAYSGSHTQKLIRIETVSAPKPYILKIDLLSKKSIYETQMEAFKRQNRMRKASPLRLTDYIKKGVKQGVEEFTKALHSKITTKVYNRTFKAKINIKEKTEK